MKDIRPIERVGFKGLRLAVKLYKSTENTREGKLIGTLGLKEMVLHIVESELNLKKQFNITQ